jgi:prepilin-type N-terminal cleavage/methylation domain-containing protein
MITNPVVKEKMLMSTAGKVNNSHTRKLCRKKSGGFTLIELVIVIFLAGLMLSITVPVVREAILHDNLKTASRKLVATIEWLRDESVSEYRDNVLLFDLGKGKYWVETPDMNDSELRRERAQAQILPEDVRILDIDQYGSEKKVDGETGIRFSRKGYMGYSLIHLADESDRKFTLVLEPFLGKVKIKEDYLNFEDLLSDEAQ